ncbi:uncharacterized protein KZ484_011025 [Pholidichthys leucotaenia]
MTSVSKTELHRLDVPQQNDFNQEEVLEEQLLLNQERNFIVVQVEADCSQIKEEREDVCISQEGEQIGLKQEPQTFDEDFPEQHVCENEFSPDKQLWNQEENSGLEQEESEPPQLKMLHSYITVTSRSVTRRGTLIWSRQNKMLHRLKWKRKNFAPVKRKKTWN